MSNLDEFKKKYGIETKSNTNTTIINSKTSSSNALNEFKAKYGVGNYSTAVPTLTSVSKAHTETSNKMPTFKTPEEALAYANQNNIKVAGNTNVSPKLAGTSTQPKTISVKPPVNLKNAVEIPTAGDTLSQKDLQRVEADKETYRTHSQNYINQINKQNEQAKSQGTFEERMKTEAELYSEYEKKYKKAKKENNLELMAKYSALMNNSEFAKEIGKLNYEAGNFGANYKYGSLGTDLNETVSNYLRYPYSAQNLENKEKIRQAEELMRLYSENAENYGKGGLITKDFAGYLPQAVDQTVEGVKGALGGSVAGGAIGTAVTGGPGAGTITGAIKGAQAGYAGNVARYSYNQMLGGAYKDLVDLGVPEDIALNVATDTALWQSIIEGAGAGVDMLTLGVGKLFSQGAKTGAQLTAKKMIQQALKAYGVNLASETAEEAIQEKIAIEGEKKALEQAGIERTTTAKEDMQRIVEAGLGGFKIALVTGGGNVIGNVTVNTINNSTINSVNKQYDEYINKVKESNLTETQKQEMIADAENGRQDTMNAIQEQIEQTEGKKVVNIPNNDNISQNNVQNVSNLENTVQSEQSLGIQQNKEIPQVIQTFVENRNKTAPGLNIQFDKMLNTDGRIIRNPDGTRTISINPNSTRAYEFVVVHEMMHDLENTQEFQELSKYVRDRAITQEGFEKAKQAITEQYTKYYTENNLDMSGLNMDIETTNDMVAQALGNQEFLNELAGNKPNVFMRLYNWIKNVAFDGNKTGKTFSERRADNKYLQELKNKFETAYNTAYNSSNTQNNYSVAGQKGLQNAINSDSRFKRLEDNLNRAQIMAQNNIDNERIRNETNWFQDKNGDWKFEFSDKDMALKRGITLEENNNYKLEDILEHDILFLMYPELRNYNIKFVEKKNTSKKGEHDANTRTISVNSKLMERSNWQELIEGTLIHELQHAIQNIEGFEKGKSSFSKTAYYNSLGEIEADDVKNRLLLEKYYGEKNISNIAPESSKANPMHSRSYKLNNLTTVDKIKDKIYNSFEKYMEGKNDLYEETIQENNRENIQLNKQTNNVGRRVKGLEESSSFSLGQNLPKTDNKGRQLTKEQQEYFKDSKVRDEEGNLLVLQHGTDADFNVYEHEYIGEDNKDGLGFYFTSSNLQFKYNHPKTVYANITNPATDGEMIDRIIRREEELSETIKDKKEILLQIQKEFGVDGIIDNERGNIVAFFSNQIKNVDNINPTENPDIRYSQSNNEWQNYLDKNWDLMPNAKKSKPTLPTQAGQQAEQEKARAKLSTQKEQQEEKGKKILKDTIENISKNENANKVSYTNDFYRNMRNALGEQAGKELTGQFDNSKLKHVKLKQKYANELKAYIVDELGIKLNSEMSADVQKFGEKQITEVELKTKYPNTWQNIVKADKWFRTKYNELIDAINETRKEIYPNVEEKIQETKDALFKTYDLIKQAEKTGIAPYKLDEDIQDNIRRLDERIASKQEKIKEIEEKNRANYQKTKKYNNLIEQQELLEQNKNELERLIGKRYDEKVARLKKRAQRLSDTLKGEELWRGKRIPKRENYYRHFQEMAEGFKALHNIFTTPSDISSNLSGTSEYTKPKSKYLGLAQKRTTNETEYDAVGGFLNYLEPASYAINIDPFITELRDISQTIKNNTLETKNANKLTEYLDDFAGSLAGKTNPFDRPVQKIVGRKAMKAIEWTANRIKSNAVLGNINSSISQILNLPQVVGKIKDPVKLAQGVGDLVFGNGKYQDSQFIQERYHNDVMSQFNTKLTQQPKKFATWMLGALDEGVTKAGWNAVYRQAIENGIDNPIKYADDTMRSLVAGRGIGERTLAQESKLTNLLMPFTVETGNYWRVMKDFVKEKDFGGILITYIVGWLLNRGIEAIGASGKTFDPIDAIYDAITEEDIGILQRIGRVGGEILSSMPMGQQIASLYPEYGADFGIFELPGREDLFGSNDPTRFGTGNVLGKVFSNPVTGVALPWGGTQLRRTLEGANALIKDGDYKTNSKGEEQLKFPIDLQNMNTPQKIGTTLQTLTLGKYAVPTADDYFEDGALTVLQTKGYKKALETGLSAEEFYEIMNAIENIKVPTLKNKEGKEQAVSGARKELIKKELDSRKNLTNEQKKLFYDIFYSKELK